jgi:hypothetical protein
VHREAGVEQPAGVGVVDADQRRPVGAGTEALVDRERPDGRGQVAAVGPEVDHRPVHRHLGEGVVDIGVGPGRRADDGRLGQRGDAAAHPVELTAERVGAAQGGQQQ